ncbi:MAG: hypothetical protein Q7W51_10830 [Coriobacteriia bacterium]|nr:hypothetical protein [Coriobacteriia bacterium]
MRDVLIILLFAGLGGMLVYQVYMIVWAKKVADRVPKTVTVLRIINIVALLAATGLIGYVLLVRG